MELKYMIPYIPYGVHLMNEYGRWHNTTQNNCFSVEDMLYMKMLLRPLNNLNKQELSLFSTCFRMYVGKEEFNYERMLVSDYNLALSLHLDIFGLIEKDLAIDKTKL